MLPAPRFSPKLSCPFAASNHWPGPLSALFSMLGHKGDLMFVHFRRSFEEPGPARSRPPQAGRLPEPTTSYLSIVELGIYESTSKVYAGLIDKGIQPYSAEWKSEIETTLERHRQAMAPSLAGNPRQPLRLLLPYGRRRGESKTATRNPWPTASA